MGRAYNTSLHHKNLHKTTFLPMLCSRPSIKDVYIPKSQDPSPRSANNDDPLSPKISCIGQVKRNNKIAGFPNHTNKLMPITTKNNSYYSASFSYFKLKRFFSGRNLTATTATRATTSTTTCRRRRMRGEFIKKGEEIGSNIDERYDKEVSIVDLDPPLPVIIKKKQEWDKAENLWKRRLGGVELRGLQLQQIQLNQHHHQM